VLLGLSLRTWKLLDLLVLSWTRQPSVNQSLAIIDFENGIDNVLAPLRFHLLSRYG
jgi:hypothetical protein